MIKVKYLIIIISFTITLPSIIHAQVYTFDFLTYSDQCHETDFPIKKGKITGYIFKGINEFDESGKANSEGISYSEWFIYVSYRLYNRKNVNINSAFQASAFFAKPYWFECSWGNPWLWANLKVPIHFPLWLRVGFEFGKIGSAMRIEDDKFDIGLSSTHKIRSLTLELSVSYRIRTKGTDTYAYGSKKFFPIGDITGLADQAGNEIHYKLEPSKKITQNTQLSLLIMGYHSGNKKYLGKIIPDSESFKTAFGTSFAFRRKTRTIFIFSFLIDAYGRYDKKGFALVFNIAK